MISRRASLLLTGLVGLFVSAVACGGGADEGEATSGPTGKAGSSGASGGAAAGSAGKAGGAGAATGGFGTGGMGCDPSTCKGTCVAGQCCAKEKACGTTCCSAATVCSFGKCEAPGAVCIDETDCGPKSYCELSLGDGAAGAAGAAGGTSGGAGAGAGGATTCVSGAKPKTGKCLPEPPVCPAGSAGSGASEPLTCVAKCEYHPPPTDFTPEVLYAWGGDTSAPFATDVMMAPIVVELDDDDCDGKVTERDIPEIAFTTFASGQYNMAGTLHVISIVGGKVKDKWMAGDIRPGTALAGGNVDGLPGNELVACSTDARVRVFDGATGKVKFETAPGVCYFPAIADMDQDGVPEIIVEGGIFSGKDGTTKASFDKPLVGTFAVSDIDGDGKLDVVTSTQAFHADGKQFIDTGVTNCVNGSKVYEQGPAVADLDKDGKPEVVGVCFLSHTLTLWRYDATAPGKFKMLRPALDINGMLSPTDCPPMSAGAKNGGGPATVGDFNGDGYPDVALAGGVGYAVMDGKKLADTTLPDLQTFLWVKKTQDCSSAGTGSSLFDFDGDGKAEVVYADETRLRIYEGATGKVLFETCNTSGTLVEYPVIADVDNDGHADIVVASNAYAQGASISCMGGGATAGVRVFGDKLGRWVRTRRVWNEHAYHITNVEEDGTIPKVELANYTQPGLDNFRQNKQPGSEFSAPDAVVSVAPLCPGPGVVATVRNVGQSVLPAGVLVGFYAGKAPSGQKLGQGKTTVPLSPAQSELVVLPLSGPADVVNGTTPVYAVVDDGMPSHPDWHECRTDNNTSAAVSLTCDVPK